MFKTLFSKTKGKGGGGRHLVISCMSNISMVTMLFVSLRVSGCFNQCPRKVLCTCYGCELWPVLWLRVVAVHAIVESYGIHAIVESCGPCYGWELWWFGYQRPTPNECISTAHLHLVLASNHTIGIKYHIHHTHATCTSTCYIHYILLTLVTSTDAS